MYKNLKFFIFLVAQYAIFCENKHIVHIFSYIYMKDISNFTFNFIRINFHKVS